MKNAETYIDIQNPALRAYNRAVTSLTIFEEDGDQATREYFQQFSDQDRTAIAAMMIAIKRNPEETLKRVQAVAHENAH